MYKRAVFHPDNPHNKPRAASFIINAAIKKENVITSGRPDSRNPRKRSIAEQEQSGVTIPSKLARTFPTNSFLPPNIFLVRSGEK